MLLTGQWSRVMVDFQPFWEKPPLFIWMQALSMQIWGVEEFAARLPNAICGIVTLVVLFRIGSRLYDNCFGWLWVLAYAGSFLPHFYFKSGIIDPFFNLFMFLGIYWLLRMTGPQERTLAQTRHYSILAGVFVGLAVLTKGPVGLLLPGLTALGFWAYMRFKPLFYWSHVGLFLLFTLLVSSAWYGLETAKNGIWFLKEFIVYQIHLLSQEGAGHGGPFYYHLVVLLIGCFPASVLAMGGLHHYGRLTRLQHQFKTVMVLLLTVVLAVFSIVETKIVHYSSLAYFPLTFLAAQFAYHQSREAVVHWRAYQSLLLVLIGSVLIIAFTVLPFIGRNPEMILPYIQGEFARGNLQAEVAWSGWEALPGIFYLLVIITAFVLILRRSQPLTGFVVLFAGTLIVIQGALYTILPRIERYTQHAAIEFYQGLQGKDVYVEVLGFKSYAHLFYQRKQPENASAKIDKKWLLEGAIDKPAYFVVKNHDLADYYPARDLQLLYRKNGFVFLKRLVSEKAAGDKEAGKAHDR